MTAASRLGEDLASTMSSASMISMEEHSSHGVRRSRARVAVIAGVARNADSTRDILDLCCRAKSEGKIDRIIVSTWHTDIPNWRSLGFGGLGIEVISDNEPAIVVEGHIVHQVKALGNGLSLMEDGDVCLKFRTDRCVPMISRELIDRAQEDLEDPDLSLGFPKVFSKRIRAPYANPSYPFLIHDIEFLGLCGDLKKLIHFDMSFFDVMWVASPEAFLHSRPFFDLFPGIKLSHEIRITRISDNENLRLFLSAVRATPALQAILASYWAIVSRYYSIGWGHEPDRRAAVHFNLFDAILNGVPALGIDKHQKYAGSVCYTDYFFRETADHSPVLFPALAEHGFSWRNVPYAFLRNPPFPLDAERSRSIVDAVYGAFPAGEYTSLRGLPIERGVL
jgi:hypothetical protein